MSAQPLSFPTLLDEAPDPWEWPAPPFGWQHFSAPVNDDAQPCRIETHSGRVLDGEMLGFDPIGRRLTLRLRADSSGGWVSFSQCRRLTLTTPLKPQPRTAGALAERVPVAAQEREYSLHSRGEAAPMSGRTAGHVEAPEGMYLFTPVDEEASLQRVFVPRSSYARCEFGPSAEEVAARLWVASPSELLQAIELQKRKPVLPLGQSLLALGLLTKYQLDRALARRSDGMPLGESLVAAGVISSSDLQTALAHKMGYPLVDLTRFPIESVALSKLSPRLAESCRAAPLMLDKDRLIVAVDRPSRLSKLQAVHAFAGLKLVPVLAPKSQILVLALERQSGNAWSQEARESKHLVLTTA